MSHRNSFEGKVRSMETENLLLNSKDKTGDDVSEITSNSSDDSFDNLARQLRGSKDYAQDTNPYLNAHNSKIQSSKKQKLGQQLQSLKKVSNPDLQNKMLLEIMDERESTPVLIKPSVQMNFNEDHFYSRASSNGLPEQPSALLQPPVKNQNLP